MRKRFQALCIKTGGLIAAGLFYAFICNLAGRPIIPCLFHMLTGLYCPGCGVSHMCLALLSLDPIAAFKANAAIFLLLPPCLLLGLLMAVHYIKTGDSHPGPIQSIILCCMIIILLLFGLLRNLPGFDWLQPQV